MKLQLQPDHQEQLAEEAVKPQIQPNQENLSEEDVVEALVQPDSKEQLVEDAMKPQVQPDQEEQPNGNILIRWIKKITKKG